MSQTLSVQLQDRTMQILDLLAGRTSREKADLVEEALANLFEEYKEIIVT